MEQTRAVSMPASVDDLQAALRKELYVADRGLAMSVYLALQLRRPLFLEGEAGVGKTEVAKALSSALGARLIRLQCYEGLDVSQAVYEWNYSRQLLHIRLLEASGGVDRQGAERELFSEEFLIKRPLLQALEGIWPDCAADRRTRPRRRRVRGLSSGDAVRFSDHHPGDWDVQGGRAAGGCDHVQPDA